MDPDRISAELKRGILALHLPKKEQAKPQQIQVRVGQPGSREHSRRPAGNGYAAVFLLGARSASAHKLHDFFPPRRIDDGNPVVVSGSSNRPHAFHGTGNSVV